ncbi:hypothetical protein DM02DRAFT_525316 [Periconia macrospinosa]|uniref:C2H2-type domain-containing protein n=1 Tax=Periconia macrospinosa TaxID=97972 RepID=A0A2V1DTB5_9PLEO|nr:hypothetical protein DM02DRAFT_525316 [Periconia macrospinosa]
MLGHKQNFGDSLEVATEVAVPDAGCVAETIDRLRKGAIPEAALDNGLQDLILEQQPLDIETLNLSFEKHLEDFMELLTERNKLRFSVTTLAHLKQYIINLQARQHRERRQQGFARLSLFLERFEQLSEMINQSPDAMKFMGCIWGPVKFLLEATEDHLDASSEILAIYEQIGRNQPSASMYTDLTVTQLNLTHIISETYKDVIEVNKWLVLYFQQRLWTELYTTTWSRHKPKFSSVIARMVSRYDLVGSRASISQFDSFLSNSTIQEEQRLSMTDRENFGRMQAINAWLKPTDLEFEQEFLMGMRANYPDTCRWLLRDDTFDEWFDPQCTTTTSPKLLWLNGKPGAGKTVLASVVVQEARALKPTPTVLFFYFKHEDSDRNNFLSMARTLLMQIIKQTPLALDYFYHKCCNSGGALLSSRTLIEELLAFALGNCTSAYIVLDGIDECQSRREKGDIVKWFRDLVEEQPADSRDRLRCLFVSQVDSARKDYNHLPSITVDLENNEEDIESFCKMKSSQLVEKLKISVHEANDIAASVSASAEGNFLFAHLMWINLCGQSSIDSLDREIKSFPTDLDKLDKIYARIMKTIMRKSVRAEREEAMMVLGWLVCAKRSLKMHEIQTMKSINLERRVVEFERRRFRVEPKDLCESLVEVRDDGTVELVHMTARSFLANSEFLDAVSEELRLTTLCIDYLNLPSFDEPYTERAVLAGEYGFMEYAILYWVRHLEAGLKSSNSEHDELHEHLTESFEILIQQHWNNPPGDGRSVSNRTREMLEIFSGSEKYLQIQLAVTLTDKELKNFGDLRPDQSALDFAKIVSDVRHCIETTVQNIRDQRTRDDLKLKYGINLFKCPRFSCRYFNEGFSSADERDKHIERHERPFRCTDEHCRGSKIGFATKTHLEKHRKENHPDTTERPHDFPTEEEIIESMNDDVPEPEAEPDPEPQTEEEENDTETQPDIVVPEQSAAPRRKTKQDYECSHCNKKFNKKFNWQSHLKSHGEGQQLHCPHCDVTCKRSGDLARHMRLHDPDIAVTCGGILWNGQRWGCGQSFARADILRSHYQSKRGRQCIAERDSSQ